MKIREKIKKIQNLPEKQRKLILWVIMIILSLSFFIFWFVNAKKIIINFQKQDKIKIPTIPKEKISEELNSYKSYNFNKLLQEEMQKLDLEKSNTDTQNNK